MKIKCEMLIMKSRKVVGPNKLSVEVWKALGDKDVKWFNRDF